MPVSSLSSIPVTPRQSGNLDTNDVRAFIAKRLDIDVKHLTDDAHLHDDFGLDWLDRLELLLLIEDEFIEIDASEEAANQLEVVSDLLQYIELTVKEKRGAMPEQPISMQLRLSSDERV